MKVIGFHEPGGPEVLEVLEVPDPEPGPGEVRIRVHAATVNPTDVARRQGLRTSGPDAPPPPHVPGMDAAGVLDVVGPEVETDLVPGDHVITVIVPHGTHGAYSEKVVVPVDSVVRAPRGSSHVEASTLLMNSLTARLALDTLGLSRGEAVAVTGAAGAFGGYAVQLAKADGLTVIADAAESDRELVNRLGADVVIPRGDGFAERVREHSPEGVGGAIDGAMLHESLAPAVRDGGTIATIRGYDDPGPRGITFQPVWVFDHASDRATLDELRRLAEDGTLTLRVAHTLPKEQADEAHRKLDAGGVRGRLVLEF